ncbi:MAG: hypothetical protein HYW15_03310 [Candidatus Giovannonibacteria bacterium]|nr:MAG: hypothetical protein HYW15_03310 [Candidatus Giovannonibacteria bacterium]
MSENLKEKALKITEALYRTTDLFSDAEPLKWALRENALEIMGADAGDIARMERMAKSMLLKLELASSGTFISKANFEVLTKAYSELMREAVFLSDSYRNLLDSIAGIDSKQIGKPISRVSDRHELLLAKLRENGRRSAGELAKMLGGQISEKTVQRELSSLVASGAIKQDGEKRWRRYFI